MNKAFRTFIHVVIRIVIRALLLLLLVGILIPFVSNTLLGHSYSSITTIREKEKNYIVDVKHYNSLLGYSVNVVEQDPYSIDFNEGPWYSTSLIFHIRVRKEYGWPVKCLVSESWAVVGSGKPTMWFGNIPNCYLFISQGVKYTDPPKQVVQLLTSQFIFPDIDSYYNLLKLFVFWLCASTIITLARSELIRQDRFSCKGCGYPLSKTNIICTECGVMNAELI